MTTPEIKVFPDPPSVAAEAARRIVRVCNNALAERDEFSIMLAGGSTPKSLYELLAVEEFARQFEWPKVQVFFGDERCVPPDHPDSNYRMAREALLSKVPIPGDNIYRIRGEIDPEKAAIEYGQRLKDHFGDAGPDVILLGMGDDGHTASLFPGTEALKEPKHRCVANYVEKFKAWRVTTTAPFINRGGHVMVLVCGSSKTGRLQEVLEGPADPQRLPIQLIQPVTGQMSWLLDAAAAGM